MLRLSLSAATELVVSLRDLAESFFLCQTPSIQTPLTRVGGMAKFKIYGVLTSVNVADSAAPFPKIMSI